MPDASSRPPLSRYGTLDPEENRFSRARAVSPVSPRLRSASEENERERLMISPTPRAANDGSGMPHQIDSAHAGPPNFTLRISSSAGVSGEGSSISPQRRDLPSQEGQVSKDGSRPGPRKTSPES